MRRAIIAAVALLVAGFSAQADEVRQIIAASDASVTVDGVLDEPIWREAAAAAPFVYVGSHKEAGIQTAVRVAYDDTALYVAVELSLIHI